PRCEGGGVPGHGRRRGGARARPRQPPRCTRLLHHNGRDAAGDPARGRAGRVLVPGRLLDRAARAASGRDRRRWAPHRGTPPRPTEARARALLSASDVAGLGGDMERSRRFAEEALSLYRAFGGRRGSADALIRIGGWFEQQGELERAEPLIEEARAVYREVDDQ